MEHLEQGPSGTLSEPMETSVYDEEAVRLETRGRRIERVSAILTAVVRVLSFLLQSVSPFPGANVRITVAATSAACLQQYYASRNDRNGSQPLWSPTTLLWPTFLTLIVAIIILIFNGIIVCSYCCGVRAVERWVTYEGYFSNFATAVQTILSTIATGATFGTATNPDSLNSQTCGPSAPSGTFPNVNLNSVCFMQVYHSVH
jgi:hypothetical protein